MEHHGGIGTGADRWLGSCERRFADILELLGDGLIVIDRDCRVRDLNARAEKLTGWALQEARAVPVHEICQLYDRRTRRATWIPLEQVMTTGVSVSCSAETTLVARDGRHRCVSNGTMPVCAGSGEVVGAMIVLRECAHPIDSQATAIDLSVLRERVGGDDPLLHEFLRRFLVTARSLASTLRVAVWRAEADGTSSAARELGAAARAVGAWRLARACADLQNAARISSNAANLPILERFNRELEAVEQFLENL